METLLSLISILGRWCQPTTEAYESPCLEKLPTELILQITNLLPTSSAALFCLSSRSIMSIVKTESWQDLKKLYLVGERFQFLSLLQRDLPEHHILWHYCKKLHFATRGWRYTSSTEVSKRYFIDEWNAVPNRRQKLPGGLTLCTFRDVFAGGRYIHPDFSFSVFEMAMKTHRLT